MRRRFLLTIAVALVLSTVQAPPAWAAPGPVPLFIVHCGFSHRAPDDPIVYPGLPGKAHSHDFFGNRTTDAHSTLESLRAGATTCDVPGDTAAYWMPTIYDGGVALHPSRVTVYYRNFAPDLAALRTFPPGFRMVWGNTAGSRPLRAEENGWACRLPSGLKSPWTHEVPRCAPGDELVYRLAFPECWNGELDSADHRSHVARYTSPGRACPPSHPYPIPRVSVTAVFDADLTSGGPGITFSSGSAVDGAHWDFFNSWDQARLEQLFEECLRQGVSRCKHGAALLSGDLEDLPADS